jgi:hypothetical protein
MTRASERESGWSLLLVCTLVVLLVVIPLAALIAYGFQWPAKFQARVPYTNMQDVLRTVGSPRQIRTNLDGTVTWDFTHWWSGPALVYFRTNGDFYRIFTE